MPEKETGPLPHQQKTGRIRGMARESKRIRDERRFGRPERLADIVLNSQHRQDWSLPEFAATDTHPGRIAAYWETVQEIRECLSICPVIDGTGACRAYWDHPQDVWGHDDFPNVAPPFETFFVEANHPGMITVGNGQRREPAEWMPRQWGFLFRSSPVAGEFPVFTADGGTENRDPGPRKWDVRVDMVMARGDKKAMFYPVIGFMPIDENGKLLMWPSALGGGETTEQEREEIGSFWASLLKPILFALSFLHCKNVAIHAVEPDARVNRERRKNGMKPFLRYHTINIEPMKRVLRTEGQSETQGLNRALHICRGHFSTYSAEKPLFGKVSGTFWVPSHVRGSIGEGAVVSDYKIERST
jgi:hypothetical protein